MVHYYSRQQESEFKPFKFKAKAKGLELEFTSSAGVFSKKELDFASKLLIENVELKKNDSVLDLGCGMGIIGIFLKRLNPSIKILFSDISMRALELTSINLKNNKIDGQLIDSNIYDNISGKFDVIVTNPPIAAGREVCFRIIEGAKDYLNKGGSLQLVARHQKGGRVLGEHMKKVFGNVKELVKSGGFRVYLSKV